MPVKSNHFHSRRYTWQAFDGIDPGEQQGGWDRNQLAGNWCVRAMLRRFLRSVMRRSPPTPTFRSSAWCASDR